MGLEKISTSRNKRKNSKMLDLRKPFHVKLCKRTKRPIMRVSLRLRELYKGIRRNA